MSPVHPNRAESQMRLNDNTRHRSISCSKAALMLLVVMGLTPGCTTQDERQPPTQKTKTSAEGLRDNIEHFQPKAVRIVLFREPLRWTYLNDYFVLLEGRNGPHLVEMVSECKDLHPSRLNIDMTDVRANRGVLRVHDTIRRCKIKMFYKLPEPKAVEIDEAEPPEQ